MDIIVISGFLGSGKTTLLLRLAHSLVAARVRKIAIIENEVGKVGVDDQAVAAEGLTVKELFSGCICCTLRVDLVNTLLELEKNIRPDTVIVEPSGVAGPHLLLEALRGCGARIERKVCLNLVDASRPKVYLERPTLPIIERGIGAADLVLINKMDTATPEMLDRLATRVREFRPQAEIRRMSALSGEGTEGLAGAIDALLTPFASHAPAAAPEPPAQTSSDAAVFADQVRVEFSPGVEGKELRRRLAGMLASLSGALEKDGGRMIGHIKAILKDDGTPGYLLASVTEFGRKPAVRGRLGGVLCRGTLTLNAIVYGIDSLRLAMAARAALRAFTEPK